MSIETSVKLDSLLATATNSKERCPKLDSEEEVVELKAVITPDSGKTQGRQKHDYVNISKCCMGRDHVLSSGQHSLASACFQRHLYTFF